MTETARLGLPLLAGGQAQKHVTVNEAFQRIDALGQLVLVSRSMAAPPVSPAAGACHGVPTGATGDWSGEDGRVAIFAGGGWVFATPDAGWRAWIADEGTAAVHDGATWRAGALAVSPGGAGVAARIVEVEHLLDAGAVSTTDQIIPDGAIVLGVTGRVTSALGGTAASFRIGIAGVSDDRYGSGIGTGQGAWFRGVTSSPLAYFGPSALTLTGEGGDFGVGGAVRIAVHLVELGLPA